MNGQCLIFIVKRLVEDSGRLSTVTISRDKASIHATALPLIEERLSHDNPRSRREYANHCGAFDSLKVRLRMQHHVTLKTYGLRFQSSYYRGASTNRYRARVLRGQRRSDGRLEVSNFRILPENSCHLSTPRERSIFTIL